MSLFSLEALADLALKATLVLGLAALATALLRRGSAATRHLVWTLAVAAVLVLPALRVLAPQWSLPLLPASPTVVSIEPDAPLVAAAIPDVEPAWRDAPRPAGGITPTAPRATERSKGRQASANRERSAPARPEPRRDPSRDQPKPYGNAAAALRQAIADRAPFLGLVWAAGALLVAAPLFAGWLRVWVHGRRRGGFASPAWAALLAEIRSALALTRAVRLLRGRANSMPMAWGLLRPAVVLPEDAEAWPVERRRAVLTHELGHVKRNDCMIQALAQAACALYWFHPLAWLAAWRLRVEREHACDDLVLTAGASSADYADHLLQLARAARAGAGPAWALAMARPSQLEGRLLAILDPSQDRRGPSRGIVGAAAAAVAAGALVLAGMQPWARPVEAASTTLALDTLGADTLGVTPRSRAPESAAPSQATQPEAERASGLPAEPARLAALLSPVPQPAQPQAAGQGSADEQEAQHEQENGRGKPASPAVVAALSDAIRDQDAEVRRQAIHSLGELRVASAAPALASALGDEDGEVRAQAAHALGELGSTAAVDALGKALSSDADAEVRQQAAFALGRIRAESAVPALTAALADKEAEVRRQAVFALGELRAKSAVEGLQRALVDEEGDVRTQAAFALGEIGDARAVPALTAALADADEEVREQAAFALGQLRADPAVGPLTKALGDAKPDVRKQAAFALSELRSAEAVPGLLEALKDADEEVRGQAAFALGEIGDDRASEPLMKALKDASPEVRRQAAFALGQLAGPGGWGGHPNPNPNSNPNPNPNPNPRPRP